MDDLTKTAVMPALKTIWLGHAYEYVDTISSTNDVLKQRVAEENEEKLPHGMVLVTDYQSKGRGRLGRRWEAQPGTSLMLSLLLRPDWPAERALWLTMMAGLAAAEAIERLTVVPISLKWPNDVGVERDGVWYKLGGLLVEGSVAQNGRLQSAVVGMGLNVNMMPEQLPEGITPVTSLLVAGGQPIDRQALLLAFLVRMEAWYETAVVGQSPVTAWAKRLVTLGREVQVRQGEELIVGTAVGVDEWGQLRIKTGDGSMHTITTGDVTLRP
ncbi:MAG: biotin--[acetyl-CoA-carboxylase] ligase [Anaerolineae bacterium]|nr:biotin--[acetyl-CoA-carboxylase] ligase [Anaerolineae bacterium]